MTIEVKIAEFKSRLSEHLRSVRHGAEILIKDRETPVARVIPHSSVGGGLQTVPARRTLDEVRALLALRARKRIKLTPGALDEAIRESRADSLDKWLTLKSTSTRR